MVNRAKLTQDKVIFVFDYDPQRFSVTYSSTLAVNQVLDANNPDIRAQSVATSFSLSGCLLVSAGLKQSQAAKMKQLQDLVLSRQPVKFTYGNINAGLVYIADLSMDIKAWSEGKPSHVEVSLTLKVARATPAATKVAAEAPAKATANMSEQYAKQIKDKLANPATAKKLNANINTKILVGKDKVVKLTTNGKTVNYKLSDFGLQ